MVAMLATSRAEQMAKAPIYRIEKFEQAIDVVDRLRTGQPLFVDFGNCFRAIDFVNGAACAIDLEYVRFSGTVYFYAGALR